MISDNFPKPAKYKGIFWLIFAASATCCAFFLPVFIIIPLLRPELDFYAAFTNTSADFNSGNFRFNIIYLSVIIAALYHSLYRVKASNHDLKLRRSFIFWTIAMVILIVVTASL